MKYKYKKHYSKVCPVCNNSYLTPQRAQIYCGNPCKSPREKNFREIICLQCSTKFTTSQNKKFCSFDCRNKNEKNKRIKTNADFGYAKMATGTIGAISELLVCADLLKKGFEVFRSVSSHCSCDLAIVLDKQLYRVEVTTGCYGNNGNLINVTKDPEKFDILVVVTKDGKINYMTELPKPKSLDS